MNKREEAEMASLRNQLALAKALRWIGIEPPKKIPPPSGYGNPRNNGWNFNAYQDGRVFKAWSESTAHGDGHLDDVQSRQAGSQNGVSLYTTALDALIGLRLAKEAECARILAQIDRKIEEERAVASS